MNASLNAPRRSAELDASAGEVLDLIVIGGGVTGTGIALDAATRGLTVALVERHDLASGTSSWSSKLVHGGLRYLASGAVGIAMESAVERRILMERTAPHLIHPMQMVIPLTGAVSKHDERLAAIGGRLGDGLRIAARTARATLPSSSRLSPAQVRALLPQVRAHDLRGGLGTWDGQLEDDSRLVIGLARTAAMHGARILTRLEVLNATGDSVDCVDGLSGQTCTLRARHVINAAGVWASSIDPTVQLRPSKGAHIVVPAETLGHPRAALAVPVPHERARYVFALPQADATVLIGLTDDPLSGPIPDSPAVLDADVSFLLSVINEGLSAAVTEADIIGRFAGLRPLLDSAGGATSDISRKHAVIEGRDGVLTVVGGKLTTYRRMAQDALDAVVRRGQQAGPVRTRALPLIGAGPVDPELRRRWPRLVRRYGSEATLLAAQVEADPSLAQPVADGVPTLLIELVHGVAHELALHAEDLLARRCRLDFVDAWRSAARPAAEAVLAGLAR